MTVRNEAICDQNEIASTGELGESSTLSPRNDGDYSPFTKNTSGKNRGLAVENYNADWPNVCIDKASIN